MVEGGGREGEDKPPEEEVRDPDRAVGNMPPRLAPPSVPRPLPSTERAARVYLAAYPPRPPIAGHLATNSRRTRWLSRFPRPPPGPSRPPLGGPTGSLLAQRPLIARNRPTSAAALPSSPPSCSVSLSSNPPRQNARPESRVAIRWMSESLILGVCVPSNATRRRYGARIPVIPLLRGASHRPCARADRAPPPAGPLPSRRAQRSGRRRRQAGGVDGGPGRQGLRQGAHEVRRLHRDALGAPGDESRGRGARAGPGPRTPPPQREPPPTHAGPVPARPQYFDFREGTGKQPRKGDTCVVDWTGVTIGYYGRPFEAKNKTKGSSFNDDDKDFYR